MTSPAFLPCHDVVHEAAAERAERFFERAEVFKNALGRLTRLLVTLAHLPGRELRLHLARLSELCELLVDGFSLFKQDALAVRGIFVAVFRDFAEQVDDRPQTRLRAEEAALREPRRKAHGMLSRCREVIARRIVRAMEPPQPAMRLVRPHQEVFTRGTDEPFARFQI